MNPRTTTRLLALVALLVAGGCATGSFTTGRPKGPDGSVVATLVCEGKVDEAKEYLYARGLGYPDVVERIVTARKECK